MSNILGRFRFVFNFPMAVIVFGIVVERFGVTILIFLFDLNCHKIKLKGILFYKLVNYKKQ